MGVQVIGSGGQTVTAVGAPTKRVNAAAVRIVGGGGVTVHNLLSGRDAEDAHPISAITGLQAALDAAGGGGSVAVVAVAVGDGGEDIDLDGAGPDDVGLVLVWGRSSGNGVYDVSVADGWVLVDPQPTTVIAQGLVDGSTFMPVLNSGVWSLYTYAEFEGGWNALGSVPNLGGNSGQLWGPTGWVTPDSGGPDLSDTTPQALGTAAAGDGTAAARDDHVHAMPTAADVGAAAASHTHNGTQVTIDASGFNGNLTTSDDTVQEIAQKLDDLSIPAAGIPATIIDAKGDLIVGAADNTAARLAVGTAGQVPMADSGATAGVRYGHQQSHNGFTRPPKSGAYYGPRRAVTGTASMTAGVVRCIPYVPRATATFDRLVVYTNATTSGKARFGVYLSDGPDGLPGTLVVDGGEVDTSTTAGDRLATISTTLNGGQLYWLATIFNTTTTVAHMAVSIAYDYAVDWGIGGGIAGPTLLAAATESRSYGPLPATMTPVEQNFSSLNIPYMMLRVA